MLWSNLYPSCCGNTGRLLHGICKYAGERVVARGPRFQKGLSVQENKQKVTKVVSLVKELPSVSSLINVRTL